MFIKFIDKDIIINCDQIVCISVTDTLLRFHTTYGYSYLDIHCSPGSPKEFMEAFEQIIASPTKKSIYTFNLTVKNRTYD